MKMRECIAAATAASVLLTGCSSSPTPVELGQQAVDVPIQQAGPLLDASRQCITSVLNNRNTEPKTSTDSLGARTTTFKTANGLTAEVVLTPWSEDSNIISMKTQSRLGGSIAEIVLAGVRPETDFYALSPAVSATGLPTSWKSAASEGSIVWLGSDGSPNYRQPVKARVTFEKAPIFPNRHMSAPDFTKAVASSFCPAA